MKSGTCPRCQSREVFRHPGHPLQIEKVTLKPGTFGISQTAPDRYICASCGLVEYYVASEEDRQVIRESWERVPHKS
jgi:hypothetical protein